MKKILRGSIDYANLKCLPEKHERATASYFADRGEDIAFIKPSFVKGSRSPDFIMHGRIWETKSPIKYSKRSFEDNFKKAIKQSENIIFDLRRLKMNDEKKYLNELEKWSNSRGIKTLLIITKDGRLLTFKGKFVTIFL